MSDLEESNEGSESNELNFSLDLAPPSPTKTPRKLVREFVFLLKDQKAKGDRTIVQLVHPRTGKLARFIFNADDTILEIQRAKRVPSSYFIDQTVVEDGSMYLTSPIDPLFLVLNRLDSARNKKADGDEGIAVDRSQLEADGNKHPFLSKLLDLAMPSVKLVCDVQEVDDVEYFRLNDAKVVEWLKRKVDVCCDFVSSSLPNPLKLVRAQASGYRAKKGEKLTQAQLIDVAIGFVGDYLSKKWVTKLKAAYATTSVAAAPAEDTNSSTMKTVNRDDVNVDYMPAKYGRAVDNVHSGHKRSASNIGLEEKGPAPKKPKTKAHEKIDTRKISKLTSFFTPKKEEKK